MALRYAFVLERCPQFRGWILFYLLRVFLVLVHRSQRRRPLRIQYHRMLERTLQLAHPTNGRQLRLDLVDVA